MTAGRPLRSAETVPPEQEVAAVVDHLFRRHAGRLTARLARRLGAAHLALVDDIVQDALLQALRSWPFGGVPDDPAGWLYRGAHNRALDAVRRDAALGRREPEIARWAEGAGSGAPEAGALGDDELALVFACCHPAVPREAAVVLALKAAGGFGVGEIARALLLAEPTVAQRLVRARRRLRTAGVAMEVPTAPAELARRLPAVLETLYLLFNEGYAATGGDALVRRDLCAEALRLARLVAAHPATAGPTPEALCALLALHAARLAARTDAAGEVVLLADQDRGQWSTALIAVGFHHLERAAAGPTLTRYHLEAEIAAHHAAAPTAAATDWPGVLAAYDRLLVVAPSPVAAVHRAVAVGMVHGAPAALAALARVGDDPALARYLWLPATRAHWRARAGDVAGAAADYRLALSHGPAGPAAEFLRRRLAEAGG